MMAQWSATMEQKMQHDGHDSGRAGFFASRANIVLLGFLAIAGYFLITEHFMHGGHGGHSGGGGDDKGSSGGSQNEPHQRWVDPPGNPSCTTKSPPTACGRS
jgi:hypothetical protein